MTPPKAQVQRRIALVTGIGSGALVLALFGAYVVFGSQLALAQAADSTLDVITASILAYVIGVAAQPEDHEHPFGHSRAEPIGALITAVIAGVLAIEVLRSAIGALWFGEVARTDVTLLLAFAAKVVFKSLVFWVARARGRESPALQALAIDARNDVLLSTVAIVGYFGARAGYPAVDAWLALPVGLWIGAAGIALLRENLRLLMGEAPPPARQAELARLIAETPGVCDVRELLVHHLGTVLDVRATILVAGDLTARAAHDIGEAARARLLQEGDVGHVAIHIDAEVDPEATEGA
ncbi:MAG: cation transporter [Myxococcales bacterium]|nr:cation transporter [Myxococcales bacterium]MCB9569479.1 cation transporter [Myxococcales bacterium]MCB9706192.1 cation transporter [Myxococcales bacterium]